MARLFIVIALFSLLLVSPAFAQDGPIFEYLGVVEHSPTSFEYQYAAHNVANGSYTPTVNVTDVHLEGQFAWDPGKVTVSAPIDWSGVIDGLFINWTVEGTGGIQPGGTVQGFSIFIEEYATITESPVHWTDDPLVTPWQNNVFASTTTQAPLPEPGISALFALSGLILLARRG